MKQSFFNQYLDTFSDRHVQFHSAALAFYMVVALPAFIVFFLSIAGLFISTDALRAWLGTSDIVGLAQLENIRGQIVQFSSIAAFLSALLMIWSGSAIFHRVQQGLRAMWHVQIDVGHGLRRFVASKMLAIIISLLFVVGIVGLFIFTQVATFLLTTVGHTIPFLLDVIPIAQGMQFVLLALVIALVYELFGDSRVSWQLLLPGSVIVATLFTFLQFGFQSYVKNLAAVNWYGAAGSIVALLLLMYVLGIVFYSGAVWMYVYADRHFKYHIKPRSYAHHNPDAGASVIHRIVQYIKYKL